MIDEGVVTKIKGKTVYVEIARSTKCDTCKVCAFATNNKVRLPAISKIPCAVGDRVHIQMPQKDIVFAPLYLYAIPIIFMLIGVAIGLILKNEAVQIVLAFALLIPSLVVVFLIDKFYYRAQEKYNPVIIQKLENTFERN